MVCWLLKIGEEINCLQQSVLLFAEHREHLPFFIILLCFLTLLCSILLLPISFFKFLLRLKAATGSFWKISSNALFIDKMFQCLRTTLVVLVETGYMLIPAEFLFLLRWWCLFLLKVLSCPFFYCFYMFIYELWLVTLTDKPLFQLLAIVIEVIWWSADAFDSKRLTWLYGILSFGDLGWSESIWIKFWRSVFFR